MKTQAAIAFQAGKPLEIVSLDLHGPRAGEVLVELKATGVCHTDARSTRSAGVDSRSVGTSWRVDETYISIRGRWHYLYRAVDKHGKTIDFLLRRDRGIAAAQAFFRKALTSVAPRVPRKITLDGHVPDRRALWLLRREHPCWRNVTVRTNRYLNNASLEAGAGAVTASQSRLPRRRVLHRRRPRKRLDSNQRKFFPA